MKIQSILIDGFKNLSNVRINLDSITALVALNNFGKSNLLMGIDFGLDFIKSTVEDKIDMMSNTEFIPLNKAMIGKNYRYEMEVSVDMNDATYIVYYGFEFSWKKSENEEPQIISEHLKIKSNRNSQKYKQLIKRDCLSAFYKGSETGRCSSKIRVEPSELVINKLKAFDDIFYIDIIKKINRMKIYMENNLEAAEFYQPDPIIRKGLENEMINIDNLPRVIYHLKEKYSDKYELLKDVFVQLFPDIEEIIVKQIGLSDMDEVKNFLEEVPFTLANAIYILFVKDRNLANPVNFSSMSDGAKRLFMILTKVIVSSISDISLIAIEEPENSVHPVLFQAYIRILNQLLDGCKIIITSHSPYVIDYLEPEWIHVGVNRDLGVAEFFSFKKTARKQLEKDAKSFGMSMGDYLFSLLSDSDSNLNDYLEKSYE